ncbi:P-loop NTPase [Mucilaginibacter ginsenosidivorans]|uniref:Novel STAND NTPase 5 domain-containing protein n=1 Tax=Mucilaginibacter ginsenosidivorans TaxID=398053 RepID=A0A5B8UVQ2_9SPHI|nr:hypothetical protein [Mucilaginibacter ginsenosidivorans]QEC62411.1 hypothetical protein FRZ54_07370 [Mucilaginibacter ginsenosidivorans]
MSKLQEIEQKLIRVNDAVFQNVCDAVLFSTERNFSTIHRTGSQKGKQKTTKGTPDSYFLSPIGRYTFVEYTTKHKDDNPNSFLKKLQDDILRCLDENITKIPVSKIEKIIYCYNTTLTTEESDSLSEICKSKRIALDLIGIDQLALLLLTRAAYAAKAFLAVNIDTAQILPVAQFISEYESSGIATVLSNQFIAREAEQTELINLLNENQITIVRGAPGTGKSKLVLASIDTFLAGSPDYTVYCISNKNAAINEDLRTYVNDENNYLIFIDDANRQYENLNSILGILREQRKGTLKIILTVRDYAFDDIVHQCRDLAPAELNVPKLSDEQITEIITGRDFNIKDKRFIRQILEIAEGNPRLAIMAAKVALKTNNLLKLYDASAIYDEYFQNAIPDHRLFKDRVLMKTVGLIAFFFAIDRTNTIFLQKLLDLADITTYEFNQAVEQLERLELIETNLDLSIIKIGDQVLATYFFFKVFLKDQLIKFEIILENFFNNYSNRVKDSVIPANTIFGYNQVIEKITPSLDVYWTKIKEDEYLALKFLQTFWFYRYQDVFAYLWERIRQLPATEEPFIYDPKTSQRDLLAHEAYLDLLDSFFAYHFSVFKDSLELSFEYIRKKPQFFTKLIKSVNEKIAFSFEDQLSHFTRQKQLFELLTENFDDALYRQAFYILSRKFLKSVYRVHTASRKKNTISWYEYQLPLNTDIKRFRTKIWRQLIKFQMRYPLETQQFIYEYSQRSPDWVKEHIGHDLPFLLQVFKRFDKKNFVDCYIIHHVEWWFNRLGVHSNELSMLKSVFTNRTYEEYKVLSFDRLRDKRDFEFDDHDEYNRLKEAEIRKALIFKNMREFKGFYSRFVFLNTWAAKNKNNQLTQTVDMALEENSRLNPVLGLKLLKYLIESGNESLMIPWRAIKMVMEKMPQRSLKSFYKLLTGNDYPKSNYWVLCYFEFAPFHLVDKKLFTLFLKFIAANQEGYFSVDWDCLDRFRAIDKRAIVKILTIVNSKIRDNGKKWRIDHRFFLKYINDFKKDMPLLQEAYLLQESMQDHFDFSCEALYLLIEKSPKFLLVFIESICKGKSFISSREYSHLNLIWKFKYAEKLLEEIFLVIEPRGLITEDNIYNAFFERLDETNKNRAIAFLKELLKKYHKDSGKVSMIMEIVIAVFKNLRKDFIRLFLSLSDDYDVFTEIKLAETNYFGPANVNVGALRAAEWEAVLECLNEIRRGAYKYAAHKTFVLGQISAYKRDADYEYRAQLMFDRD